MNILILSSNKNLYSTKRLVEEAKLRGHHVEVARPDKCYMDVATGSPMVYYRKRKLDKVDIVIPRIGASVSAYGMAIVRQFEMMGVYCLNSSNAIGRSRDKLRSLQILSQKHLPLPKTGMANNTQQTESLIKLVGGAPMVVKLIEGSQGKGVILAETKKAAESLIDAFRILKANFLVQEFIKDANGADIRCFVVGGKVIGTMMRQAKEGEFRSNIHRGGIGSPVKITPEERKVAIAAAKAMKLNMAGVDIIRSGTGPKILEVNSSPGLEGIEGCTNKNIAVQIIDYVEKNYTKVIKDN
ncbi:30S ribosomal protein S6--L-glutamate ligase [Halobacteriovorax sp. XZX-3]|uniref:30S ribosomal protein S6--L-glutamate ligase n=1 Tax=unclassified Halobacteriovorax TaxID=2639665 RepID=UPI000CD1D016|nr:30S ribosomal protein S6--L-glutamate ligase [Halobacteriovorax sp. DA5]POB13483.1 30S ribosomal protein S6--L-glutamate ligase [Halobacteriovorax sp. DA5]